MSFSATGCCCRNASQREVPQCENIPPFIANTMASVCASLTNAYWAPTDPPTINANTTARKTARGAGIKDIDIPHAQPCLVVRLPLRGGRVFAPVRGKQRSRDPARTPPGLCPGTEPGRIHLGVSQATRPGRISAPDISITSPVPSGASSSPCSDDRELVAALWRQTELLL